MTIKLLTPRGKYPANAIVTLDAATENALVGDKVASTDLTGGVAWLPEASTPDPRPLLASEAQAAAFASLVSGDGISDGVVLMGDSIATYNFMPIPVGSITDNGNGTATVTWDGSASLQTYAGDTVAVEATATAKLNVVNGMVLSHTIAVGAVTAFVYKYDGGDFNPLGQTGSPLVRLARREGDLGFLTVAKFLTDGRFRIIENMTIGGLDSEQMEAFVARAIALKPKAICIQIGTNNVYARLWPASRTIASLKRLADLISQARIIPVFGLILPRSDGQQDATKITYKAPVNRWMREYLPSIGGYCVDHWPRTVNGQTFADMSSTVGAATAGFLGDNIHPARPGAWAMGKAWAQALAQIFPAKVRLTTNLSEALAANGKLFFPNPLLTGAGGDATGSVGTVTPTPSNLPAGVHLECSAGVTVTWSSIPRTEAADGDAAGNNLRFVITGAVAGSTVLMRMAVTPANFAAGDLVQGGLRVKTSSSATPGSGSPSKMSLPELLVQVNSATSGSDFAYAMVNQNPGVEIDEAYSGILLTKPTAFKAAGAGVHGATGFMRLSMNLYFRGAGGSATVDVSHPFLGAVSQ